MKKSIFTLLAVLIIISMVGCAPSAQTPKTEKVVYLINGALGDNAFYDSGQLGINKIADQYKVETSNHRDQF